MRSGPTDKQDRRWKRDQPHDTAGRLARRAHLRRVLGPTALIVLVIGGVAYVALRGDERPTTPAPAAVQAASPFGQHYDGLVARRARAHVPTMMQTMSSSWHFHPRLAVYVNDRPVTVPANIGIDPRVDGMQMAGLHTHDDSGTIHVEGLQHATLGQFMTIWGVALSPRGLGSYRAGRNVGMRMWVNATPSRAFGALKLADGQRIVISYGRLHAPAPGL